MSHVSRPLSAPGGRPQRRRIDHRPRRHSIAPASTVRVGGRLRCISFAKWAARKQRAKAADAAWEEVYDYEQNVTYFYNSITQESSWFDPRSTSQARPQAAAWPASSVPEDASGCGASGEGVGAGGATGYGHWATYDADYQEAAGYTKFGLCPKPTLLGLARATLLFRRQAVQQMEEEIQWVQAELIAFEREKQAELQAVIQQLQDELEQAGDADDDLKGMLTAFGNITAHHDQQHEDQRKGDTELEIDNMWEEHREARDSQAGAHRLERERQRAKLQERLEARRKKKFAQRLAEIDRQLDAKRQQTSSRVQQIRGKFVGTVLARDKAIAQLRKLARAVHRKPERVSCRSRRPDVDGGGSAKVQDVDHGEGSFHVHGYTPWVELVDEGSGHKYWYNHDTGAAQWYPPPELGALSTEYQVSDVDAEAAAIDEAARLAEQWVTKDAFAVEQAKTEELERVAQQMRDELERRRSMSAGDLLSMLEGFMDLENETDVMKDQAETLYKDMQAERDAVDRRLEQERDKQRKSMQERLRQRRQRRARRLKPDQRKLEHDKKLVRVSAAVAKRKVRTRLQSAAKAVTGYQRAARQLISAGSPKPGPL